MLLKADALNDLLRHGVARREEDLGAQPELSAGFHLIPCVLSSYGVYVFVDMAGWQSDKWGGSRQVCGSGLTAVVTLWVSSGR